jgi:putative oxidoreductase
VGFPGFLAYPVIAFEIIGGAMLILGILPRWIAGLAAVELLVASTVHWANGWAFAAPNGGGWEYPVFLAVTAAALALLGDGAYAMRPSLRK